MLEWKTLQKPVIAKESGPDPVAYTNLFLLKNSSTYPELLLKSEADYRLYSELKRRIEDATIGVDKDSIAFEFEDLRVWVHKEMISVYKKNMLVCEYTVHEFSRKPNATFRRILASTNKRAE